MKNYVLVSHNHNENIALYYMGMINGSYCYSTSINNAIRFDENDIIELIKSQSQLTHFGFSIARIEDCTFESLKNNKKLEYLFTNFLYVV